MERSMLGFMRTCDNPPLTDQKHRYIFLAYLQHAEHVQSLIHYYLLPTGLRWVQENAGALSSHHH